MLVLVRSSSLWRAEIFTHRNKSLTHPLQTTNLTSKPGGRGAWCLPRCFKACLPYGRTPWPLPETPCSVLGLCRGGQGPGPGDGEAGGSSNQFCKTASCDGGGKASCWRCLQTPSGRGVSVRRTELGSRAGGGAGDKGLIPGYPHRCAASPAWLTHRGPAAGLGSSSAAHDAPQGPQHPRSRCHQVPVKYGEMRSASGAWRDSS